MSDSSRSVFDPLWCAAELDRTADLFPLGFPVRVSSNSLHLVQAAEESWREYPPRFSTPPLEIRLGVAAPDGADSLPAPPVYRGRGHLAAIVAGPANFVVCDHSKNLVFGWVTPAVAADPDYLRYFFLEAAAYIVLAQRYLTLVHAACVARGGRGVLLSGESGAGKTTLAYACARRGWTFLADDSTALLRGAPEPRLLGKPFRLRFRDSAAELFPELAGRWVGRSANGKPTIEMRAAELGLATALECRLERLVFLRRGLAAAVRLDPVRRETALDRLLQALPFFGEEIYAQQRASLCSLLEREPLELGYERLDEAVDELERVAEGRLP